MQYGGRPIASSFYHTWHSYLFVSFPWLLSREEILDCLKPRLGIAARKSTYLNNRSISWVKEAKRQDSFEWCYWKSSSVPAGVGSLALDVNLFVGLGKISRTRGTTFLELCLLFWAHNMLEWRYRWRKANRWVVNWQQAAIWIVRLSDIPITVYEEFILFGLLQPAHSSDTYEWHQTKLLALSEFWHKHYHNPNIETWHLNIWKSTFVSCQHLGQNVLITQNFTNILGHSVISDIHEQDLIHYRFHN